MIILTTAMLAALAAPLTTPLRGTVVDVEGKPVAGAAIWLVGPAHPGEAPVVAEGQSDEQGRFAFDRPTDLCDEYREAGTARAAVTVTLNRPGAPVWQSAERSVTLWAFRAGMRVALQEYPESLPGSGRPIRLVLGPAANTELRVTDPEMHPLAGVRIRLSRLTEGGLTVPRPLADRAELRTDSGGRAVLDAFAAQHVAEVEMLAPGYGSQRCWLYPTTRGPKLIWLWPVAKVTGRLTADDAGVLEGWTIRATTAPVDPIASIDAGFIGEAEVTTDSKGNFEVPAIAAGYLSLACRPPRDLPYRADDSTRTLVRAGRANLVKVSLAKAIPVEGVVRDHLSGAGVAGARVVFTPQVGYVMEPRFMLKYQALTDKQGRFGTHLIQGNYQVRVASLPPSYTMTPNAELRQVNAFPGGSPITVDPFELIKAEPPVRGKVIDESGRPVKGATVTAGWELWVSNFYGTYQALTRSDEAGEFQIERVPPLVEVRLTAQSGERATLEPYVAWTNDGRAATLRLTAAATAALRGRVVATDGKAIESARVWIEYRRNNVPQSWMTGSIRFDRVDEIRTAADGSFRTPCELLPPGEYRALAIADGYVPGATDYITPTTQETKALPDLIMRPAQKLRTVSGRVVDPQGRPIEGATVLQSGDGPRRSQAQTDALGRFALGGVADGPAFVFAQKPGFRFGGRLIGGGDGGFDLVLARAQEPPPTKLKTLSWSTPRDEERSLVRTLLEPIAIPSDLRIRIPSDYQLHRVLRPLGWADPPRLLAVLSSPAVVRDQSILDATAIALWEMKGPEAVDMINSEPDPCARAHGLLALETAAPLDRRKLRTELLLRAGREAGRVTDHNEKLSLLGRAAARLIDMGEADRATPMLREGWKLTENIKREQCAQGIYEFAPALASFDLSMALALVQGKDGGSPLVNNWNYANQILGTIAWRVAGVKPTESEKLLAKINAATPGNGMEGNVLRACQRMATKDLELARRLATSLSAVPQSNTNNPNGNQNPNQSPRPRLALYGQLVIAKALAASKPDLARKRLEEAIAGLRRLAIDEPKEAGDPDPACVIAGCLPLVEQLMPDRVAEYLWLAVACRAPLGDEPAPEQLQLLADLAAIVARYDRAAAEVIAAPVFDQVPVPSRMPIVQSPWNGFEAVFLSLACLDPKEAFDLVSRLPEEAGTVASVSVRATVRARRFGRRQFVASTSTIVKRLSRVQLAEALVLPSERRRLEVLNRVVNPWLLESGDE
jgi:hypothetical protein